MKYSIPFMFELSTRSTQKVQCCINMAYVQNKIYIRYKLLMVSNHWWYWWSDDLIKIFHLWKVTNYLWFSSLTILLAWASGTFSCCNFEEVNQWDVLNFVAWVCEIFELQAAEAVAAKEIIYSISQEGFVDWMLWW